MPIQACFAFALLSASEDSLLRFCPDSGALGVNEAEELIELQPSSLWILFKLLIFLIDFSNYLQMKSLIDLTEFLKMG